MSKPTTNKFSPEVRSRAVRMVFDHQAEYPSQSAAINSMAGKIGCTGETLRSWVRQAERDQGLRGGPTTEDSAKIKALERENRELRQANETCARRRRILPRRSSTARSSDDRLHRRSPRGLRGRANLQGAADCPVHLPRPGGPAHRPGETATQSQARPGPDGRYPTRIRRELRRLRRAQGVAPARAGGKRGRPMHGGPLDAQGGPARGRTRPRGPNHRQQSGNTLSTRPSEPAVPRAMPERAVAVGLHLRRDLARLRLRRLRHRRLCPPHRGLAREPHGPCCVRNRCAGAGLGRSPSRPGRRADTPRDWQISRLLRRPSIGALWC